jgi:hypothetical protein
MFPPTGRCLAVIISSPVPALAGRLPELRRIGLFYQTAGIARKTATSDIKRTPSKSHARRVAEGRNIIALCRRLRHTRAVMKATTGL